MTRAELKGAVKASGGERQGDGAGGDGGRQTVNKGFRFHPDQMETVQQAIDQMKGELPTDHDNVAMEHICAAYLTGPVSADELRRLAQPAEVDSVESAKALLKDLLTWLRANSDCPYDACAPVVEVFESIFPEEEAEIHVKAN